MQYTYEEAIQRLRIFLEEATTRSTTYNRHCIYCMFDALLQGEPQSVKDAYDRGHSDGYKLGVDEERDSWSCK